jgi:hypothetical protein
MRKHFVLWVAALLLATAAFAAEQEVGQVVAIDPAAGTFTVKTDDGDHILYRTEPSTRLMRSGATVELGDVSVGARVTVTAPEGEGDAPRLASNAEFVAADADAAVAQPSADTEADDRMSDRLPGTASPLPLIALVGAGAMVAGLVVRRLRR